MHMLRDKRSHTDQHTDRFCCSTLMHTAVYLQIQIIYVMEFPHSYVSPLSHLHIDQIQNYFLPKKLFLIMNGIFNENKPFNIH